MSLASVTAASTIGISINSGSSAALYQSGVNSVVTNTNAGGGAFVIGNAPGAFGYYNLAGGTVNVAGEIDPGGAAGGAGTFGQFDMTSGTVSLPNNTSSYFLPNRGAAGETSVVNFNGASFR